MNKKGFAPIIIILVIAVVAVGGGMILLKNQNPASDAPLKISTIIPSAKSTITFKKVSADKLLFSGGYADPAFAKLSDGTLVLYVNKFGQGPSRYIAYTSTDGLTWKEHSASLPSAATGRAYMEDGKVRFYYPGMMPIKPSDPPAAIFSSISTDGFTFTKEQGTRISPLDNYYLEGPSVIKLADKKYRMFFNENETASKEKRISKIWGASSTDGLTWTRDAKPTLESDSSVEKAPADWPQALHPFVLKTPEGKYLMFYNTHSKVYAAISDDAVSWKKVGYTGIEGADVDGYFLNDNTLRLYYGNFTPQTSGVVYTVDLKIE